MRKQLIMRGSIDLRRVIARAKDDQRLVEILINVVIVAKDSASEL
jgi:hypothetical protein